MATSDDLFRLIKSLKQSEKRYFKIFSSTHVKGEQNNYVKLFEAVDKQDEYNEATILKKFKGEKFIKQFSVTKNYLYNFILKSLRSYYSGKDVDSKINEELESIKILNNRGFYKKALKIVKKTKQLAWEYEKLDYLIQILEWEYDAKSTCLPHDKFVDFKKKYLKERAYLFELIENRHQYGLLIDSVYELYRTDMVVRTEEDLQKYEEMMQNPLLQSVDSALTYSAKKTFYNIWALYHTIKQDFVAAFSYDKMQLDLFEENSKIKEDKLDDYIEICHNLLYNCIKLKHYDEFKGIMDKVKVIPEKKQYAEKLSFYDYAQIFDTTRGLLMRYYFNTRQFENALELIPSIKKGLWKFRIALDDETKIYHYFEVGKLLFHVGDLDNALEWVSEVDSYEKQTGSDGLICYARILKLFIYYDLGDSYFDLLQYEIKSTKRFLQKKNRFYQVEETILKYLYRLVSTSSIDLTRELYVKFKADFQYLMQQKFEESASSYLDLTYWLDSKIEQVPLKDVLVRDWKLNHSNK
ncbi:MAG: hypothetical protein AB8B69_04250 [Chitinophagales bacterium]